MDAALHIEYARMLIEAIRDHVQDVDEFARHNRNLANAIRDTYDASADAAQEHGG